MTARDELPRLLERPHGSTLLTRDEVADLLGYSRTSMATVMGRDRDRWPRPAAMLRAGVRSWAMLWDRDEILAAAPPATAGQRTGAAATISDPDGLLTCLECGLRFRALGRHLRAKHDMAAAEYREIHQLPATGALTADGQRQRARDYTGYSFGGILASALAIPLIPAFGWRACYLIGALPLVTLVPLCLFLLPESVAFLRGKGRTAEADDLAARLGLPPEDPTTRQPAEQVPASGGRFSTLRVLFTQEYLRTTVLLWAATFMGLLLVYGLATWIPQIMRSSGYELGPALLTGVALNVGAIIGTIIGGHYGDRLGLRRVLLISFACAALANIVLSLRPSFEINLVAIGVAGFGSIGTAILMNAFVAAFYPTTSQATAVGWALGVGRIGGILGPIVGGAIAAAALPVSWNFYVFGLAAVLGAVTLLLIPGKRPAPTAPQPREQPRQAEPELS